MPETIDPGRRFGLDGRIAAVTGASRGIGAALAAGLAEAGARVFGLSRTAAASAKVEALPCDLSDAAAIRAAFDSIAAKAGRLDILVNAGGISLPPSADPEAELQRFKQTLDVDLFGPYACVLAARPLMRAAGGGAVINVTSINSQRGFPNNPGYVAAKAGLAGLTRALAVDLAADRIRVNALAPGYFATEFNVEYLASDAGKRMMARVPMQRPGAVEELDGPLLLLASDAGRFMTGSVVTVDGGHLLVMG